jgi:hypothetical protein
MSIIRLKTLDGKTVNMTVNLDDTIESTVDDIKLLLNYNNCDIKVIFNGKVLTDKSKTFTENNIKNDDFIVITKTNLPVKPVVASLPPSVHPPVHPPVNTSRSSRITPILQTTQTPPTTPVAITSESTPIRINNATGTIDQFQIDQFWNEPVPISDTEQQYSLEQIQAIMPYIFSYVASSPLLLMRYLQSPSTFGNILIDRNFRNLLRQIMGHANETINTIRSRSHISFTAHITDQTVPITTNETDESPYNTNDSNSEEEGEVREEMEVIEEGEGEGEGEVREEMEVIEEGEEGEEGEYPVIISESVPELMNMMAQILGITNISTLTENVSPQEENANILAEEEQNDIENLIGLTGMPRNDIIRIYLACNKNANTTASMLFDMMN